MDMHEHDDKISRRGPYASSIKTGIIGLDNLDRERSMVDGGGDERVVNV